MAIHHLVSRGVEVAHRHADKAGDWQTYELPKMAVAALAMTAIGYFIVHLAIHYTYGLLVPNLIMTEAPSTTTVIKTTEYRDEPEENESPDAPLLTKEEKEFTQPRDEEVLVITHKPVTAKFCTVVRHLKEKTGSRASRFRGAGGYITYNMAAGLVSSVARSLFPYGHVLIQLPLLASLCLLSTAWVQQTVAMPGTNFFQRVGELRRNGCFRKLYLPVLFVEAVQLSVFTLPGNIMIATSALADVNGKHELVVTSIGTALAVFTFLFSFTCVVIPLNIGLTRLQASLLPENVDTVVSIDRSLGGAAVKDVRAAWKSFSRGGIARLVKTWIKVFVMQVALAVVAIAVVAVELKLLAKPQFDKIVEDGRQMYRI